MRWIMMLVVMLGAGEARAEVTEPVAPGEGSGLARLMEGLPDKALRKISTAPERFIEDASGLILGFGGVDGIGADGIERFIAVERAAVRGRELRRLLVADLDDDGQVSRSEIGVLIAAAGARERGRLHAMHLSADFDGDGIVTGPEVIGHAREIALRELPEHDAEILRGLMLFDLDGDGRVTIREVRQMVEALQQWA